MSDGLPRAFLEILAARFDIGLKREGRFGMLVT